MIRQALFFIVAFAAMEGVSYLAHRYVYHKVLWLFHRSHHAPRTGTFEWNDIFPLFFASVSIGIIWIAVGDPLRSDLLAVALGISLYGIVYFFLHDIYVHRRISGVVFRNSYFQRLKRAHMVHHTYGREPYGLLLFPVQEDPACHSDDPRSKDNAQ